MLRVARQGILFRPGAGLVRMGMASFGLIAPPDGAIVQERLDVLATFNTFRVRRSRREARATVRPYGNRGPEGARGGCTVQQP
ncbi:MAG: hypothetical protein M1126_01510 [Candidatus Thermoplasmatota archaeon]|nr:hypothetical protein [Candidatus Thermoplasmatota archaeon]